MKTKVMGVVLVLIIIAAVVFVVKSMNRSLPPVETILEQMIKVAEVTADPAVFKITEVPLRIQEREVTLVPETQYMYHAKSGKTYAHVLRCVSCKKQIPVWPFAAGVNPRTVAVTYRCPLCGGKASPIGGVGDVVIDPD